MELGVDLDEAAGEDAAQLLGDAGERVLGEVDAEQLLLPGELLLLGGLGRASRAAGPARGGAIVAEQVEQRRLAGLALLLLALGVADEAVEAGEQGRALGERCRRRRP